MLYKINIDDRSYNNWQIFEAATLNPVTILGLEPSVHHLCQSICNHSI